MLPDITIQALIGLFKHLYRVQSIPFEWDKQNHVMKLPRHWWNIWLWYINFFFACFFTSGIICRFLSNVLLRNLNLAEFIVCFYIVMYQLLYSIFLLNSWVNWERIPSLINQWLLFNRNSTMVSIMLEDDEASGDDETISQPEIPPEADNDSTDGVVEVRSNKSAMVRRAWKKSVRKVYKRRNRKNLYAEEMERLNLFIVIRKLLGKKLKLRQVLEPVIVINVLKNSVLSDSFFYAILMAKVDKMALIPDKEWWWELLSGAWIAYQAYTTWNNALFYLFTAILFTHDMNGWLEYCSNNSQLPLTKRATKRKFDLSLRLYRIIQILNTQFNNSFRLFVMFGHKVCIGGCQVSALFGALRLMGKVNAFSYLMLPFTVGATLAVEALAYPLFARNTELSAAFKRSWTHGSHVLEEHQKRSLRSCRVLHIQVWGLYRFRRGTILRVLRLILNQNVLFMLLQ